MSIFTVIWNIFVLISGWRLYAKFGEPGWKSLIPLYNLYVQYDYTWNKSYAFYYIGAWIGGSILIESDKPALFTIGALALLVSLVMDCIASNKLSKSFGHGIGYTLGLIFLTPLFYILLGFSADKYLGKPE